MSSKKLTVNLNRSQRMLINDVCTLLNVSDRSKVVKNLALAKADEWVKQVVQKRMEQREAQASGVSGDTGTDSETAQRGRNTDSDMVAEQENNVAESEGSEGTPE